ncbi:flagellar hook-basal body complex protein [uncultured Agitococcus sp.]|uniref:flagellar hook-basal body complex protein n=1 Tax=uncultured Agitococcus sp. TaxID=1506599 RepID=UPI002602837F|nr:flagellar hook-basal body complex protein [uncultured Agitococcus sp.]
MLNGFESSVSGLRAQGKAISNISGNIANAQTTGYKGVFSSFLTLIAPGTNDVMEITRNSIDKQGGIKDTGIVTDLAISGVGMLAVKPSLDLNDKQLLYTREGSFRTDVSGNLQNIGGSYLLAWPFDNEGKPIGNDFASLEVVNLYSLVQEVAATKSIDFSVNLDAKEQMIKGLSYIIQPESGLSTDDVISNKNLRVGDKFRIDVNDGEQQYDFTYGGFSSGNAASIQILGSESINGGLSALINGDNFSIKTKNLDSMEFKYKEINPDILLGEFNNIKTLSAAINQIDGLKATIKNDCLSIASAQIGDSITFVNGFDVSKLGSSKDISAAFGAKQFYDTVNSVNMSQQEVYGVTPSVGASALPFSSGVFDGDGREFCHTLVKSMASIGLNNYRQCLSVSFYMSLVSTPLNQPPERSRRAVIKHVNDGF